MQPCVGNGSVIGVLLIAVCDAVQRHLVVTWGKTRGDLGKTRGDLGQDWW